MLDWLKPLPLMFYAPRRGMAAVRDRAPLCAAALLALAAQSGYELFTQWPYLARGFALSAPLTAFSVLRGAAGELLLLALAFVPLLVLFANLFERRGSYGLILRQEYAPVAARGGRAGRQRGGDVSGVAAVGRRAHAARLAVPARDRVPDRARLPDRRDADAARPRLVPPEPRSR